MPSVNQIELHPLLQQAELRAFHAEHGIVDRGVVAAGAGRRLLDEPAITAIADAHGKTPAQVVLRWHLQLGNVVIPKSVTPARIAENFDVFGFELTDAELVSIATLDRAERTGPDPDTLNAV